MPRFGVRHDLRALRAAAKSRAARPVAMQRSGL